MDPLTSIAAGSKTSSFWATRELVSVLAPGIVVLCELTFLVRPSVKVALRSPFSAGGDPGLLVGLVLVIGLAWVIGYISRETAFKCLGFTEPDLPAEPVQDPHDDLGDELIEKGGRLRNWLDGFRCPQQSPKQMRDRLIRTYGSAAYAEFLRVHSVMDGFINGVQIYGRPASGGNMPDDAAAAMFVYCKLWLRKNAPDLGVENIELEINIVASAAMPVFLVPFVVASSIASHWIYWVIGSTAVTLYLLGQIVRSYRRLRGAERWEAVRNTVGMLLWQRAEALQTMPSPSPADGSAVEQAVAVRRDA